MQPSTSKGVGGCDGAIFCECANGTKSTQNGLSWAWSEGRQVPKKMVEKQKANALIQV